VANVSSFSGAMPVIPGGLVELGYSQITSNVTVSSASTGTAATSVISPLTVVCDGSPVLIEFSAVRVDSGASSNLTISLLKDGVEFSRTWGFVNPGGTSVPVKLTFRDTPTAGSHTYEVRAWYGGANSGLVAAGSGTTANSPAFLRVSKIVSQNDGLKPFWKPPIVTQLPTLAQSGDQVVYAADATNGVYWLLQYDGLGTYPWKFIGGSGVTTTTTAYPASASPASFTSILSGPSWTPPLAGDYNVRHWGRLDIYAPTAERIVEICPGTATVAAAAAYATASGNWATSGSVYRDAWAGERLMQGLLSTEALTIKAHYEVGPVTYVPFYVGMTAVPVRVKAA